LVHILWALPCLPGLGNFSMHPGQDLILLFRMVKTHLFQHFPSSASEHISLACSLWGVTCHQSKFAIYLKTYTTIDFLWSKDCVKITCFPKM
jgi:hypothetical protein